MKNLYFKANYYQAIATFGSLWLFIAEPTHWVIAKDVPIIFKGQPLTLKKNENADELLGYLNKKPIIATTNFNDLNGKSSYLGTFRKLKKMSNDRNKKKLVIYHVFEKP